MGSTLGQTQSDAVRLSDAIGLANWRVSAVPEWFWVAAVLVAALTQTVRNTAQKSLSDTAGPVGTSLARFLYGLPFTLLAALILQMMGHESLFQDISWMFVIWLFVGAIAHAAGSIFFTTAVRSGSFLVSVTLSKTEIVQIAAFSTLLLSEVPSGSSLAGMALALLGIVLLTPRGIFRQFSQTRGTMLLSTLYGLATGTCYAMAAVGYRAAGLELVGLGHPPLLVAFWCVVLAQSTQVISMSLWMGFRERESFRPIFLNWKLALTSGLAGAIASLGWYVGYVLRPAADVRILGMTEVVFSFLVSRHFLGERTTLPENIGITLVIAGALLACL